MASIKTYWLHSLRWRLTSFLGLVLLFTLLLIGSGVVAFVHRTEVAAWRGRQGEAARNAAQTAGAFIRRAVDTLSLLGLLGRDELKAEPHLIGRVLEQNLALQEVVYLNAQGRVLASSSQDQPLLANLFTIPQSQWFLLARQGQNYYGSLQTSARNEPYLIIALPAPEGAVVAARLRMTVLWNIVSDIRFGETGRAYIVNREGQIIAHTDPDIVLAQTHIGHHHALSQALQNANSEWYGEYHDLQNKPVVGVTAAVPGTDWVVITELSQQEAFGASRSAFLIMGGGLLLFGLLLTVVGTRYLERVIFRPMEELRDGSGRIGQGQLGYRINLARQDEVGQVATAFNEMTHSLQQRDAQLAAQAAALMEEVAERKQAQEALHQLNAELEQRVIQRTAELAETNKTLRAEIAERQRIEAALRQSELQYRLLIEQIPAVTYIVRLDESGSSLYASPQIKTLLGFGAEEWMADPQLWYRQVHTDDRDRVMAESKACFSTGQPCLSEYRIFTREGQLLWVQDRAIRLPAEVGQAGTVQGVLFDITAHKQTEEQLKASLYEKEMLLKEIHHRVKNNMQVISSLLNLQSAYITDSQALEIFQDSQNRVRSMALIHEKLYRSKNLAQIDLGEYVEDLATFLFGVYNADSKGVALDVESDNVYLGIDTAVPCGLIINELISNALKHAFPNGRLGQIRVQLHTDTRQQIFLGVSDNGVGFPPELDFQNSSSLGLQLVITLVGQLDGVIKLTKGQGTAFEISFANQVQKAPADKRGGIQ